MVHDDPMRATIELNCATDLSLIDAKLSTNG